MMAVIKNNKWKVGKYSSRHYFEAHRGTLLINMSLYGDLLATSTNDHLVKIWNISYVLNDNPTYEDEEYSLSSLLSSSRCPLHPEQVSDDVHCNN